MCVFPLERDIFKRLSASCSDYRQQTTASLLCCLLDARLTNQEDERRKATTMFSSSLFPQLHCKLFAKMGDDRPFVCAAPGCGQVSSLSLALFPCLRLGCWGEGEGVLYCVPLGLGKLAVMILIPFQMFNVPFK